MDIVKYEYKWIDGKLNVKQVPHNSKLYSYFLCACKFLFELINRAHYKNEKIKTISIYGLRSALIDRGGQRSRVWFYWKFGKFYT